jgi:D-beta-D-heptose 7-phosphate kinase/D-beta-D-heptose 1-phosphate adenosyltransferase
MVIPLEDFPKLREEKLKGKKIVCTSGWFDPIHPGHISCILESKKFGDIFIVIVDGDRMAVAKKGKPFMPAIDRADVVDAIKGVDYVTIYNHPDKNKTDLVGALEVIKPDVFTKGGDRDEKARRDPNNNLKYEADYIESYGGEIEYNVGAEKVWASSNYLQDWVDFVNSQDKKE